MRLFLPCLIVVAFFFAGVACDNSGTGESNPYLIPHRPNEPVIVSGIGPTNGGLGTKVVVSGNNFGNDPEKIKLFFNEREAFILKAQDNAIYAMVPKQPGEFSTIRVAVEGREGILEDVLFEYYIRETVTTVAGVYMTQGSNDGPALEATFTRVAKVAVNDDGDVLISDDQGGRIRLFSAQENRVTTVFTATNLWSSTMNSDFSYFFVCERLAAQRPILFYGLSKESAYLESKIFYDQRDDNGNYIFGSRIIHGLAADDTYVYVLSDGCVSFVRVHQVTQTVELIGQNLPLGNVAHLTYNKYDGMIYAGCEAARRVVRFNPYHTPEGRTTPWITWDDMEWIAGTGISATPPREGQGRDAQFGNISGVGADMDGNLYISDLTFHVIWKIDKLFNCTIFAGIPTVNGYRDGNPREALINRPLGMSATDDGLIYVADTDNRLVRVISIQ